jgi:hypothetical protein
LPFAKPVEYFGLLNTFSLLQKAKLQGEWRASTVVQQFESRPVVGSDAHEVSTEKPPPLFHSDIDYASSLSR